MEKRRPVVFVRGKRVVCEMCVYDLFVFVANRSSVALAEEEGSRVSRRKKRNV